MNFDLLQNWTPFLSKGNLFFVLFAKKCPVAGAKEAESCYYDIRLKPEAS